MVRLVRVSATWRLDSVGDGVWLPGVHRGLQMVEVAVEVPVAGDVNPEWVGVEPAVRGVSDGAPRGGDVQDAGDGDSCVGGVGVGGNVPQHRDRA